MGSPESQETADRDTAPSPRTTVLTLFVLLCVTLATQLGSLAVASHGDFLSMLVPSVLFLCVLTIPTAALGLILGPRIGLGAPLLTALLTRRTGWGQRSLLDARLSISLGLATGILLVLLRFATEPYLPSDLPELGHRGVLGGLLVSTSAAVAEEIWLRLGVLTIAAWTCVRLFGRSQLEPIVAWPTIVLAALAFGLMHLPQLAESGAATPIGIMATVMGNTLVGILFGWLYWRRSLIAAILAHFAVDVVLHVLTAFGG